MTDRLFLSIWLTPQSPRGRRRHFEQMLGLFPFSQRGQPQTIVTIRAVSNTEPPLLERPLNAPVNLEQIFQILSDYEGEDVSYEVDTYWDLWQLEEDWSLAPARVLLCCFGPEFDNGTEREAAQQEDLRIDFGLESHYLPDANMPGSAKLVESNIRSLLRLVHDVENALPVDKRLLETETGENFAERLRQALQPTGSLGTM